MAQVDNDQQKELLFAINEIFQVMFLTNALKENSDLEISLNMKKKNTASQKDISLFSIKVACNINIPLLSLIKGQCMLHLAELVYCMQTLEQESHLAIQSIEENNDRQINTVLWIESNNITDDSVKIMSQHVSLAKRKDHTQSAIQLRIFISINSVCACSIEICELMGCFKMMNPKVKFNLKMDFGGLVEFQLHNTSSVRIDHFNIYTGLDILDRKLLESFGTGKIVFHCSHQRKMKQTSDKDVLSIFISCIVCYVPLFATTDQHFESNHSKEYTPGSIKIQMFGPHGLPLNISLLSHAISLDPHIFLPWSDFGLHVRRKFKSSTYNLECAARQHFEAESQEGTTCDRFIIVMNFMVEYKHISMQKENYDHSSIKNYKDLLEILEKVCQSNNALSIYQEVAMSCMDVIFINNKTTKEHQLSIQSTQKIGGSTFYEQLVPGVVTSLMDIFTRSANTEFRSEVALLIPTDSRLSMSNYLETKLMGLIQNPSSSSASDICLAISSAQLLNPTTHNLLQPTLNEEDDRNIDDWNFTTNTYLDKLIQPSPDMISDSDYNLKCQPGLSDLVIDEANSLPSGQILKSNTNNENTTSFDNLGYNKYSCNRPTTVMKILNSKETVINNSDDKNEEMNENTDSFKDLSELITPVVQNTQLNSHIFCEPIKDSNQQCMHCMQLTFNSADSNRPNLFIQSVSSYCDSSVENKVVSSKSNINIDDCSEEYMHIFPKKRFSFCEDFTTQDTITSQHCDKNESRNSKKIKIATNAAEIIKLDQTLAINDEQNFVESEEASIQMNCNACLSNISKLDEENDWFDESEMEKWFAEMEN